MTVRSASRFCPRQAPLYLNLDTRRPMPRRPLLTLLFACIASGNIAAQAASDSAVSRIDHILIEQKDADPFQAAVVQAAVAMDKLERLYVLADGGELGSSGSAQRTSSASRSAISSVRRPRRASASRRGAGTGRW